MCQDLISHSNRASTEVTSIRIRTRAKVGGITRIIRTMEQTANREKIRFGRSTSSNAHFPYSLYERNKGEHAESINPTK